MLIVDLFFDMKTNFNLNNKMNLIRIFSPILLVFALQSQVFAQAISLDNLNFYAIQSANGNYWSVRSDNNIEAVKDGVGNLEVFIYEELDDTHFALRAMNNGKYVYCRDAKSTLSPSRDVRADKETYERTKLDGNLYTIRAFNDMYLRATQDGGGKIKADRKTVGSHEQFTFVKLTKVRFFTNNGNQLAEKDGKIVGKSASADDSIFSFETDDNRTYLKAASGNYVAVSGEGLVTVSNKKDATAFNYSIANTSPYYTIKFNDVQRNKVFAVGGGGFAVKTGNPSDAGWAEFKLQPTF